MVAKPSQLFRRDIADAVGGEFFHEAGSVLAVLDEQALGHFEFEAAGIDPSAPLVTTCGSGVTASVLLFDYVWRE